MDNLKLTDGLMAKLASPSEGQRLIWDAGDAKGRVRGLGVRITKAGAKSFILDYRVRDSKRHRRMTLGMFGSDFKTVSAARTYARELREKIAKGEDPLGAQREHRNAPTVAELADLFLAEHAEPRKAAGSIAEDKSLLKQWIRPELGSRKAFDITREDVESLHRKISAETPSRANRTLALLSTMFNFAVNKGVRETNPCKGVEKNREYKRVRYLSGDELARLLSALAKHPNKDAAAVVRLLLLTGARRGEVLGLKWADLDLKAATWTKPPNSTKQREWHHVPLNAAALQLLVERRAEADRGEKRAEALERAAQKQRHTKRRQIMLNAAARAKLLASSPLVFPGPRRGEDGMPLETIRTMWKQVCENAEIEDLRLHDLRHSYASFLVGSGLSLPIVGALLGHTQASTTQRYSHLALDPLRQATERVGAIVTAAETGKTAEVKEFPKRGRRK